jgi:hypothetical protein
MAPSFSTASSSESMDNLDAATPHSLYYTPAGLEIRWDLTAQVSLKIN